MNIAVFGATGGTGREVVREALAEGHRVTAFVRDPRRLPIDDRRLRLVTGDVRDPRCVAEAVEGQEAVVIALGSHGRKDLDVRAEGTANVIRAMQSQGVPRVVVVSAGGAGDSYKEVPLFLKVLIKTVMKNTYADHDRQERFVKESGLDWVIVRPAMLVDGPATGRFDKGSADGGPPKSKVSRADVACFVLQQLTGNRYLQQAPSIPRLPGLIPWTVWESADVIFSRLRHLRRRRNDRPVGDVVCHEADPGIANRAYWIWFHIAGELATAILLILSGAGLLASQPWASVVYLVAMGMLFYTVIVSPGYFAQKGQWVWVLIFAVLLVLGIAGVVPVARSLAG